MGGSHEVSVAGSSVLRVFRFRTTAPEFDGELRAVLLPDLIDLPGVLEVFAGRRGHSTPDERIVASIWTDRQVMVAAVGEAIEASPFHPELLDGSTDRALTICGLEFGDRTGSSDPPTVLRLVEGTVGAGEFETYVTEARDGMIADRAAGRGPMALYLGRTGPDSFVTLSLWPDWATLQDATGGDIDRPIATRHAERLVAWTASHYEVITPTVRPQESATTRLDGTPAC